MSSGVALISPTLTALTSKLQRFGTGGESRYFRSCGSIARSIGPISAGLIYFTYGSSIAYIIGAIWLVFLALVLLAVAICRKQGLGICLISFFTRHFPHIC